MNRSLTVNLGGKTYELVLQLQDREAALSWSVDGVPAGTIAAEIDTIAGERVAVTRGERTVQFAWVRDRDDLYLCSEGRAYKFTRSVPRSAIKEGSTGGSARALAPMTGTVVSVEVEPGSNVEEGDSLVVVEAMKMIYRVVAEVSGTVESVNCEAGTTVSEGDVLIEIAGQAEQE